MRLLTLTVLLLAAPALFADTLADLRGALERLKGQDAVRAQVEIRSWSRTGEGRKGKEKQGSGTVQAEDGPQGLRLGWSAALMRAMRKDAEAKSSNPEAATPNLDVLKALDAAEASRLLGYGEHLALRVQGAQLLEDRADSYQGKPARLLVLKPEARFNAEDRDIIKRFEMVLKVWVAADGTPLGLEESQSFQGSKFLITFKGSHTETATLARVGNRLVALECTRENGGSGMGMSNQSKTVSILTIL